MQLFNHLLLLLTTLFILNTALLAQAPFREEIALSGDVKYLVLFVETLDQSWEEGELNYYIEEYYAANDWLQGEAAYYGVDLSFDNSLKDNFQVVRVELDNDQRHGPRKTLQAVLEKLNYRDLAGFKRYNLIDLNRQKDKLKVILFWKNNSRSYAYRTYGENDLDIAVVYSQHTFGRRTDRYVIIHEMLHQFGAWDLYYEHGKTQTLATGQKAKENWPNSVMISTMGRIKTLEVDELTAWRIGWAEYDESYVEFDPRVTRRQSKLDIDPKKTVWKINWEKRRKGSSKWLLIEVIDSEHFKNTY